MKPPIRDRCRFAGNGRRLGFVLALAAFTQDSALSVAADPPAPPPLTNGVAQLLEPQGRVEVLRRDTTMWLRATNTLSLRPGDTIRTGSDSRALLQVSGHSAVRLGELTLFQVRETPTAPRRPLLRLVKGVLYFFHRARPASLDFETPLVSGAIRGTEFALSVPEDGSARLSLFDGEVDLTNPQQVLLHLTSGEVGVCAADGTLTKTALLQAVNIIQWCLYYPAVLDPDELSFDPDTVAALQNSLSAYRAGDLLGALAAYPAQRQPANDAEKVYRAALFLVAGNVDAADSLLGSLTAPSGQAKALSRLILAVKGQPELAATLPSSPAASELLAESYRLQAQASLPAALAVAQRAVERAPQFGFAWARLAELEFSFGHTAKAETALGRALALSPRNAQALTVRGFVLAGQDRTKAALETFEQAIHLDSALGNAWLGRGLCLIRRGKLEAGQADLLLAASLEPNRAVLRSYLGKAFAQTGEDARAAKELALAKRLDPNDPTAWLYSALLNEQRSRINQAITDLEQSQALNENRRVYRSRLLLDEDQAVRSANLANLYRDAGMDEVAAREAASAVSADYANYSAHLFLADSYNQLRDPGQVNLRYETPWLSEFLLANLLAPVGAGTLSQTVSDQEYGKLFQRNRVGLASSTEYLSRGDWIQAGALYGNSDHSSFALDTLYRSLNGERPNEDLDQLTTSLQFKQAFTPQDSVYLQAIYYRADGGDLAQYYDPQMAHTQRRIQETQEPLLLLGYHHEWAPGSHTVFLGGYLQDTVKLQDPTQPVLALLRGPTPADLFAPVAFVNPTEAPPIGGLNYQNDFRGATFELQQIWQRWDQTFVAGARGQFGEFNTDSVVGQSLAHLTNIASGSDLFFLTDPISQNQRSQFNRESIYACDYWRPVAPLTLIGGLSYDRLEYPLNYRIPPLTPDTTTHDQLSPKAGVVWNVLPRTTLRGTYTRSLGGVSFDQSFRLEPSQLAGFVQAFRSLAPESVVGEVSGARFETWGVALDQTFATRTYLGAQFQWLNSKADRLLGVVDIANTLPTSFSPSSTPQHLDGTEKSLLLTANQLLGNDWSLGVSYRLSRMELEQNLPELVPSLDGAAASDLAATLQELRLFGLFNHPSGWFAQGDAVWRHQANEGYSPALAGDDFWQFNLFAGYRFLRRRVEVTLGILNLTDQDYHLNPLNLHAEYPHSRTFLARLRFSF
jgi:outer membrane receptor protein involved in Fe transport/Flp pilus assembly protein TadD